MEQVTILGSGHHARQALVEVVMCIDQTRQNNVSSLQIQYFIRSLGQFCTGAHLLNYMVSYKERGIANFSSRRIHSDEGVDVFDE